jgi:gliding motility-associated-like protein
MLDYKSKLYSPGDMIHDTLISQNSCDTILKIQVIGIPIPAPQLSADTIICKNAITTITPDQIYKSYFWSTNQTSQSIQVTSGTYVLTVTDQNDCTNSVSISVKEASEIQYELEPYDPICSEDKGRIIMKATAGGVAPIRYFLNGVESKNGVFDDLSPGSYVSEIIDAEGCIKSDTLVILPASALNISIVDKIELEAGSSVLIKFIVLDGNVKLISFNPNKNITQEGLDGLRITAKDDLQYEIQFEDVNGCIIIRTIQIIIKRNDGLYFPNIFSPNGDQINDYWEPFIGSEYALLQCSIFDRWGNMVYSSISIASWNGRSNDEPCLPGVYVYYLELKDANNGTKKMSGEITLIR